MPNIHYLFIETFFFLILVLLLTHLALINLKSSYWYIMTTESAVEISGLRPKKKNMSVSSDMSKNIRVGRSEKSFFFKFF